MMLSRISSAATPGDSPAPETPCIDVITTRWTPKRSISGLSVTTRPIVVQFGSGTMKPLHPRLRRCASIWAACAKFTPGTMIGTSSSYRNAEAVLSTAVVFAYCGSSTRAVSDSTAENTMSTPDSSSPSPFSTVSSNVGAGGGSVHHQRRAPVLASRSAAAYVLPAERSEAASFTISNHGWRSSATRNC